jgi:hypothetical protein
VPLKNPEIYKYIILTNNNGVIMNNKFEEKGETFGEHRDTLKNLTDSYVGLSEIWDQSYTKLYKPWMDFMSESTGNLSGISMTMAPDYYKEFYGDWMNTYQNSFGKFSTTQVPMPRVTLEKVVMTTEESNKICMSWVNEFGENAKKTNEILNNGTDPVKYRECLDMWRKSYKKISDDLLAMPAVKYQKEIFENLTGIPDFYSESFERTAKLWKESYDKIYDPWFESMEKFSESMTKPSKELLDTFQESIDINLNLHKKWVSAMEKMSEKFKDLSKFNADPEKFKEFFNLWLKMYEKATDDFFERLPAMNPIKEMMEPVKKACKIYSNTSIKMSKLWFDSYICTAKTSKV